MQVPGVMTRFPLHSRNPIGPQATRCPFWSHCVGALCIRLQRSPWLVMACSEHDRLWTLVPFPSTTKSEQIITRYQFHLRPHLFLYISRPQWKLQDTSPSHLSIRKAKQSALMNSPKGAPTWRHSHFCFLGLARS